MGDLMGFSAIEVGGPARVPSQLRVVGGIGGTELEVEGGQWAQGGKDDADEVDHALGRPEKKLCC
jgi:hypothetical protein